MYSIETTLMGKDVNVSIDTVLDVFRNGEQSLLLCYLPVATQHVCHIVDAPIAANYNRRENLQSLWFRLYHNAPILRLKRINLMKYERFIKVKHPDNIVIVESFTITS